jgi:TetR/AcrR family transcriptional repressor of nem operon
MKTLDKQKDTRIEILSLAENLIVERGFNGFSYKDISSVLNIKNAAVHYYFPSKSDLGVAVIKRATEGFIQWTNSSRASDKGALEKLEAFFGRYRQSLNCGQQVCLGGALETDFRTLPEDMRKETTNFVSQILGWLENLLNEGRETGVFSFSGEPKDAAVVVMAGLQGALQMARATDPDCLDAAIRQIKKSLGMCNSYIIH